jgi:hypothetical protein
MTILIHFFTACRQFKDDPGLASFTDEGTEYAATITEAFIRIKSESDLSISYKKPSCPFRASHRVKMVEIYPYKVDVKKLPEAA